MFFQALFTKTTKLLWVLLLVFLLAACNSQTQEPEPEQFAEEITLFNWADDLPTELFDQFAEEYGVTVNLVTYESSDEADDRLRAGEVFDVMVIENQFIPGLADAGLLAEIDFTNIPNFRNISANFRDLAYDPANTYSVPYSWGTTGLVVRTDMVSGVDQWADFKSFTLRLNSAMSQLWPLNHWAIRLIRLIQTKCEKRWIKSLSWGRLLKLKMLSHIRVHQHWSPVKRL